MYVILAILGIGIIVLAVFALGAGAFGIMVGLPLAALGVIVIGLADLSAKLEKLIWYTRSCKDAEDKLVGIAKSFYDWEMERRTKLDAVQSRMHGLKAIDQPSA